MLEVDTQATVLARLVSWLEGQSRHEYGGSRTHDLHLWDWEVKLLLVALRPDAPEHKPLMTSYRFGSVGDARRAGHDAPLPGDGWVPEKDRK